MPADGTLVEYVSLPGGHPYNLAAAGSAGPLYVCSVSKQGANLHAVDLDGSILWSCPTAAAKVHGAAGAPGGQLRVAGTGSVWLAGSSVLYETLPSGSPGRQLELPHDPDEWLGTFVVLPDGFLLAWTTSPYRGGRVERLDDQGSRSWSTPLPVLPLPGRPVSYGVIRSVDFATGRAGDTAPWRPREFYPHREGGILVSGDRVLSSYWDMWGSGLAMAFCLDLPSGDLVWATLPGALKGFSVAGPGRFLIGAEGYGAFKTRLYDPDGEVVTAWPSYGGAVVRDDEVIVVEQTRDSVWPGRVRILHPDGTMSDGPVLPGFPTCGPVLSRDGRAAFWRDGQLQVLDPDLSIHTLHRDGDASGSRTMLLLDEGCLAFMLARDRPTGGSGSALVLASTNLAALDDGPWPCRQGNLHCNPVVGPTG